MTEATRNTIRAILMRAAEQEAARQAAVQRGDWQSRDAAERELQRLYHQHAELEQQAAA